MSAIAEAPRRAHHARETAVPRLQIVALVVLVFGPYLLPGLRTEQVTLYLFALVALVVWRRRCIPKSLLVVAGAWAVYAAIGAVRGLFPPENSTPWEPGSLAAGLDNLAMPMAVLVVGVWLAAGRDPSGCIDFLAKCIAWAMVANTVAAWLQSQGLVDLSAWWSAGDDFVVAKNAEGNGRYSGLVNQPAEAGVLYGLALMGAVHVWRHRLLVMLVAAVFICYGGFMTVSKVFLFVSLPIVVVQIIWTHAGHWKRLLGIGASVGVVGALGSLGWLPSWAGGRQLQQILPSWGAPGEMLAVVTASRFGDGSTLAPVIEAVLEGPALLGFGAAGLQVPYDNGFLEALVYGGVVGVLLVLAVMLALSVALWRLLRGPQRILGMAICVLMWGGTMGVPVLTANRSGSLLWLMLVYLIVAGAATRSAEVRPVRESGALPGDDGDGAEAADVDSSGSLEPVARLTSVEGRAERGGHAVTGSGGPEA